MKKKVNLALIPLDFEHAAQELGDSLHDILHYPCHYEGPEHAAALIEAFVMGSRLMSDFAHQLMAINIDPQQIVVTLPQEVINYVDRAFRELAEDTIAPTEPTATQPPANA